MPRRSLLRHIFNHAPLSKLKHSSPREPVNNPPTPPSAPPRVETTPEYARYTSKSLEASAPVTALKVKPDTALTPSTPTFHPSQPPNPIPDASTITTCDLVYAAIDEATSATQAHLHTLETVLALLETLKGLSETVDVLRREMEEKKKACHVSIAELEGFERGVGKMGFVNHGMSGAEMGKDE